MKTFADLIRQNMQNVSQERITLEKEIDLVRNYLALEQLRFGDKMNYSINIDEDVDPSDVMVPPLLIQPLVENSIKHGIFPLKSATGWLEVNISTGNNALVIEVKDNGIGIRQSQSSRTDKKIESHALENIRRRLDHLSVILNTKISFHFGEINDETNGAGWTVATVVMPLDAENAPV
jgi:LytS/YehU family sensor histidine kinase